ncbi:MAG: pyrimidine/purine nucleoside phosphorylase [Mariprofundaceae bacterium]|nr:pyrimidine/purine nucleoside phosphorylase [Mariprofundaceae bacterium]
MSYQNATITKAANVYHGGKVSSRSITTADGDSKTLGFMLAGSYNFGTEAAEIMEILAGSCRVRLHGESDWKTCQAGESFNVAANSRFDIEVSDILDYICHFA